MAEEVTAETREGEAASDLLLTGLHAARGLLVSFQKEAGYLPEQDAYSTTLTEWERRLAKGIQSLDGIIARAETLLNRDAALLAAAQGRIAELESDRDDNRRLYTRLARAVYDGHPVNMAFVDDLQSLALQRGQAEQREQALREALGNAADLLEKLGYFGDADKARKALAEKGDTHG